MQIHELQETALAIAKDRGFCEGSPDIPEGLMLIVSELSEALEHYRCGNSGYSLPYVWFSALETGKPDGFAVELADAMIRICQFAEWLGIDLTEAIEAKCAYNKTRPHRHGGKRC